MLWKFNILYLKHDNAKKKDKISFVSERVLFDILSSEKKNNN